MPQFERAGAIVHYEIEGAGPPLLLIAGIASDAASWGPLLPLLGGRTLIRIDNRGAGQTRAEGALSLDDMVADCAALIGELELGPLDVVGHSMGGMIGLRLAAAHPDLVRNLVVMTMTAEPGAKERALFTELVPLYDEIAPERWFRLLYQFLFSAPFFADPAVIDGAAAASTGYPFRQSHADLKRQVEALGEVGAVDRARIICPVLGIAGERDIVVTPGDMAASLAGLAGLNMVTVAGAAHSIHWEAPEAVAREINGFLRR